MYVRTYIHTCVCIYVCMYACMCVCMRVCVQLCVCMYVCMYVCMCNELRGVIWPDSHNFLLWSHGRLLSMKSLVRVLPAAAYTFNTVPICDPGGPNPHGLVWGTFPTPVRDFTPRLYYFRETGFPKPDFRSRTLIRRRTHSELDYLPIRLQIHGPIPWTNPFTIRPFSGVSHFYWGVGLLLNSLPKPDFRSRTHLEFGYLPIRLQLHGPIPWTNPFTIRPFSGVPHYYWDVGLLLDSLPKPDFRSRTHLELGYLPIRLQMHGPIPWTNPFTIGSFSGVPHYHWDVGRPGRVSGPIPTTASLTRTGWPVGPPSQLSEQLTDPPMIWVWMYIFPNGNIYLILHQSTHSVHMSSVTQLYQQLVYIIGLIIGIITPYVHRPSSFSYYTIT